MSLPQALPYIFVGLDVAIVLSVIGAIAGEFVGAQAGLGYMILQRNLTMDMAGVFAMLVILSLIGIGLHWSSSSSTAGSCSGWRKSPGPGDGRLKGAAPHDRTTSPRHPRRSSGPRSHAT